MTRSAKGGWGSAIGSGLVTCVTLLLLALAVALVVVPKITGGMSLTVLTGSMEPGIMPGDVVVTKGIDTARARDLQIGDVITFLPYADDPMLVTHRIIAKSVGSAGTSFTTKGDNNNTPDSWNPVNDYQVRGQLLYVIPKIGYVRQWLGPYTVWIVPGIAVILLGYAGITFATSFRKPADDPPPTTDDTAPVPKRAYSE
ncbi:MAG: signal peptidase I [Propionibacteriaceae bacterium]|jgi:signal peptidase|nr:signal peptidase I [Propionibacteriaceae bacterium]